jgi:hypothetical protein
VSPAATRHSLRFAPRVRSSATIGFPVSDFFFFPATAPMDGYRS